MNIYQNKEKIIQTLLFVGLPCIYLSQVLQMPFEDNFRTKSLIVFELYELLNHIVLFAVLTALLVNKVTVDKLFFGVLAALFVNWLGFLDVYLHNFMLNNDLYPIFLYTYGDVNFQYLKVLSIVFFSVLLIFKVIYFKIIGKRIYSHIFVLLLAFIMLFITTIYHKIYIGHINKKDTHAAYVNTMFISKLDGGDLIKFCDISSYSCSVGLPDKGSVPPSVYEKMVAMKEEARVKKVDVLRGMGGSFTTKTNQFLRNPITYSHIGGVDKYVWDSNILEAQFLNLMQWLGLIGSFSVFFWIYIVFVLIVFHNKRIR